MMEGARGWSGAWHSTLSGERFRGWLGGCSFPNKGSARGCSLLATIFRPTHSSIWGEARVHRSPKRPERPNRPNRPKATYRTNAAPAHLTSMTSPQ